MLYLLCPGLELSLQACLQAASLIAVLLPTLTQMAGNAHIGKRVIAGMAAHPSGRASLRLGCMKWQARETGMHDPQGANSSAQWAVTRLWQLGETFPLTNPQSSPFPPPPPFHMQLFAVSFLSLTSGS